MGKSNKKRRELFDSSDEEEEEVEYAPPSKKEGILKVNKKYAKEFNDRKRREELANCNVDEEESSSSDESDEDEFADLLTPQLDIKIFQTINAIRRRDERLYDPNIQIFQQQEMEEDQEETKKMTKHAKLHYKDVVREQILEQMNSDEEIRDIQQETTGGLQRLAYDEEQRQIRDSFLKSVAAADDGEDDALLVVKKKQATANAVLSLQEEDALRREIEAMGQDTSLQDPRREISDGTKFLQEYMLHQKWVDPSEYDDQSSSSTQQEEEKHVANSDNENEEESSLEDLERMDEFESKYNFRFEEAIAENDTSRYNIVSYARGAAADSLRRIDDTRKQKRRIKEERKAAERKAKEEQLRRLKNAKKIELQEKLNQIRAVVGNASEALEEETLSKLMEGEFDPDKFSQIMQEAYGEDFYAKEDDAWKTDKDVKQSMVTDPEFLEEYYDDKDEYYYNYDDEENTSIVQDATETEEDDNDEEEEVAEETFEKEEENKLDQQLKQKMLDEMYKLDYEDIIGGDIKCRFKYRRVEPNSYGLSCEEILFANDSTLKQFVSLKAMNPYRDTGEYHVTGKKRKKFREMLKEDYEQVLHEHGATKETNEQGTDTNEPEEITRKKRRRQKKGKASLSNIEPSDSQLISTEPSDSKKDADIPSNEKAMSEVLQVSSPKKKRKKRKKEKKSTNSAVVGVSAARLSSYGVVV